MNKDNVKIKGSAISDLCSFATRESLTNRAARRILLALADDFHDRNISIWQENPSTRLITVVGFYLTDEEKAANGISLSGNNFEFSFDHDFHREERVLLKTSSGKDGVRIPIPQNGPLGLYLSWLVLQFTIWKSQGVTTFDTFLEDQPGYDPVKSKPKSKWFRDLAIGAALFGLPTFALLKVGLMAAIGTFFGIAIVINFFLKDNN